MITYDLPSDALEIQGKVRKFVSEQLVPLEAEFLANEPACTSRTEPFPAEPGVSYVSDPWGELGTEKYRALLDQSKEYGLWGLDVPHDLGGQDCSLVAKCLAIEEMHKTIVQFVLPPDSPNLHWLEESADEWQKEQYLYPYSRGEKTSGVAITEPQAGSDVSGIALSAVKDGNYYVLNGTKKWIGKADWADFLIVAGVTDAEKGVRGGISAFIVDRGTPGVTVERRLPTITHFRPCEVTFKDVRIHKKYLLGEEGQAFKPLQNRFSIRRLEIAARCVGAAERLLTMMTDYAKTRATFGQLLADRQMIQQWIADDAVALHQIKLMNYAAAKKYDSGQTDIRIEAGMSKVAATEMLSKVVDHCMQVHGALGVSKDLPIEYYYRLVRVWRIVEGASEVHRSVIARKLLKDGHL